MYASVSFVMCGSNVFWLLVVYDYVLYFNKTCLDNIMLFSIHDFSNMWLIRTSSSCVGNYYKTDYNVFFLIPLLVLLDCLGRFWLGRLPTITSIMIINYQLGLAYFRQIACNFYNLFFFTPFSFVGRGFDRGCFWQ